jgi:hypothetical protein
MTIGNNIISKKLWLVVAVLFLISVGLFYKVIIQSKDIIKTSIVEIDDTPYELELVKADLETYGYLSERVIYEYLKGIQECYKEYKVPIGLMHAVIYIESDYRFWIEHDLVTLKELGYSVKAVGAGAIIWELWKDDLLKVDSTLKKTDLFTPYIAIKCSGIILHKLITEETAKGYNNIVNRVLIRYYGAYLQSRYDKTVKITSELWIKRMNKYLQQINKETVKKEVKK